MKYPPTKVSRILVAVVFIIFFVAHFTIPSIAANDSVQWIQQTSGTASTLLDLQFVNKNTGWIVGEGGTILKTTNSGENWTKQNSGVTTTLWAVHFVNINKGLIIFSYLFLPSWVISPPWYGLFDNRYIGWVVGHGGLILKTVDGGKNWVKQSSETMSTLNDVYFVDANTGWVVGDSGTIKKTTNGGLIWTSHTLGYADSLNSVYFINANTGWVAPVSRYDPQTNMFYNYVLKTTDGGITWKPSNKFSYYISDMQFVDANNGWAVGHYSGILKTTDGGINWFLQNSNVKKASVGVYFLDANRGWAVGGVFPGFVLNTTDNGTTWIREESVFPSTLNEVYFIDATTGWAVGADGQIWTYNGPASTSVDTTPPTVSVTHSPLNPKTFETIAVTANASDEFGISTIELYHDDEWIMTCSAPTSCSTSFLYGESGTHTYYISATDTSGLTTRDPPNSTKNYTVSYVPSGITIFVIQSPLNPKVSESVKITATASGNAALNSSRVIYVYIDDALANICTSSPCSTSPKKYSLGDHTYYAVINEKLVDLARDPVTGIKGFRVS